MTGSYADTLLVIERLHITLLMTWSILSVGLGAMLLAYAWKRRAHLPVFMGFGGTVAGWGAIGAAAATFQRQQLHLRDYAAAVALQDGAKGGAAYGVLFVVLGLTILWLGAARGRSRLLMGAGLGVAVQGGALAVLDLLLLQRLASLF